MECMVPGGVDLFGGDKRGGDDDRGRDDRGGEDWRKPSDAPVDAKQSGSKEMKHAIDVLRSFLRQGVLNAHDRAKGAVATTTSADKNAPDPSEVRVNWLNPRAGDMGEARKHAQYAVHSPANGAIPVSLERKGDDLDMNDGGAVSEELSRRAHMSALALINPRDSDLGELPERGARGGSEAALHTSLPSTLFEAVLVPRALYATAVIVARMEGFPVEKLEPVDDVDEPKSESFYHGGMHGTTHVPITEPNYEEHLAAHLMGRKDAQRPLLTHVVRLHGGGASTARTPMAAAQPSPLSHYADDAEPQLPQLPQLQMPQLQLPQRQVGPAPSEQELQGWAATAVAHFSQLYHCDSDNTDAMIRIRRGEVPPGVPAQHADALIRWLNENQSEGFL